MGRIEGIFIGLVLLATAAYGQNVALTEFPGHVGIFVTMNNNASFCEGTILNINHVLTAGSCVINAENNHLLAPAAITIRPGVVNLAVTTPPIMLIDRIFLHPEFNPFTLDNNIAVLRTVLNFTIPTNEVPTINIANLHPRIVPDNFGCQLIGWNIPPAHLTTILQNQPLPVMNRNTCNQLGPLLNRIRDPLMCAGTVAATPAVCTSNRGAALYCHGNVTGILSFGRTCGIANSPGVFTQVRWYLPWIEQQFTRTDNPGPGTTAAPGIPITTTGPPGGSATGLISSICLVMIAMVFQQLLK